MRLVPAVIIFRIFVISSLLALPVSAHARASVELALPLDRAYSAAMRFVRVDRGCTVSDKDPDAAYVVFECPDGAKKLRGTVELFRSGADSKNVRIQVALPDEPHYAELRFVELLERKLKDDYGAGRPQPPPTASKAPPKAPPDMGTQ